MVRETKTLGHGDAPVPEPQQMPTVRNIVVYDSTRQVENWELAWVAQKVCDTPDTQQWLYRMTATLGSQDYQDVEKDVKDWDPVEKVYRLMLRWKKKEPNGLLQLKTLAEKLRSIQHGDIAEQLEP
ncbi:uncharacterized protein LOC133197730 [Saccostrea echinata]|uniref:uncharacterized protein LOC133197730 n=1 Tax=Saccostrea echinata TaxID=191078 RepID=UPI002A80D027|nr:uncharacterized protein LOC133197730 [Saccostrea echinata]